MAFGSPVLLHPRDNNAIAAFMSSREGAMSTARPQDVIAQDVDCRVPHGLEAEVGPAVVSPSRPPLQFLSSTMTLMLIAFMPGASSLDRHGIYENFVPCESEHGKGT